MNPARRLATAADQMKCPHRYLASATIAASAFLTLPPLSSSAAIIINVSEVGSDVVAVATGSANTLDLSLIGNLPIDAGVVPANAALRVGTPGLIPVNFFSGASGPATVGTGPQTNASLGSGDSIGVFGASLILLPTTPTLSYAGSSTWAGTTLAQLGLNVGTYTWNWGTGANADSITINVGPGPSSVPEIDPSCLGSVLALIGGGLGMLERRRKRV